MPRRQNLRSISRTSALSASWRMGSRQGSRLRVFLPVMSSLTSKPRGLVATLRAPPFWEPAQTAECLDVGQNCTAPKTYVIHASLITVIYKKTFLPTARAIHVSTAAAAVKPFFGATRMISIPDMYSSSCFTICFTICSSSCARRVWVITSSHHFLSFSVFSQGVRSPSRIAPSAILG